METNDFYYLIMVCAAFGALALSLAIATIRYHRWQEATAPAPARKRDAK